MEHHPQTFYATQGLTSDPGRHIDLFARLPDDLPGLVKAVQGSMIHIFWAERYGVALSEERKATVGMRSLSQKLDNYRLVDPRPLAVVRQLDMKLAGNCRDFSQLLASMLRYKGIPARPRCGFGTYFIPDHYEDHWVCEYWNAEQERWIMVDAQLDQFQQDVLKIDFDPLDVPDDRFIVGGKAWQLCRIDGVDPKKFGIFDFSGLAFVRGDLIRDILSLNLIEILPWDGGFGFLSKREEEMTEDDWCYEFFDHMAVLTQAGDAGFDELREIYENEPGLHVPGEWIMQVDR